jgi:hypothetical protein
MKIIGLLLRKNICSFIFFSSLIVCLIRYFTIASCTGNQILGTTGVINQFCIITSATTSIYNKFPYQYTWSGSPICAGFPSTNAIYYPDGVCLQDTTTGTLAYDSYYTSFLNGTASLDDDLVFSAVPTVNPSAVPTSSSPSVIPTVNPSVVPTVNPTPISTNPPSYVPSIAPSPSPSRIPTVTPTTFSGGTPSRVPTTAPTVAPSTSNVPTIIMSQAPSSVSFFSFPPTMNNNNNNSSSSASSSSSGEFSAIGGTGGLSGIIVGGVVLIGLAIGLAYYCYYRKSSAAIHKPIFSMPSFLSWTHREPVASPILVPTPENNPLYRNAGIGNNALPRPTSNDVL